MAQQIRWKMKAVVNLYVRATPSNAGKEVTVLKPGDMVTATEKTDSGWYKHSGGGWSYGKSGAFLALVEDLDKKLNPKPVPKNEAEGKKLKAPPDNKSMNELYSQIYGKSLSSMMRFQDLKGIYGLPYQYCNTVDRPLGDMKYGWIYADKIISKMPLLVLTPGRPAFLAGFDKTTKDGIISTLGDMLGVAADKKPAINDIIEGKDGRYYTFNFAYSDYYRYVNTALNTTARYLGIADQRYNGTPLGKYNWQNNASSDIGHFVSGKEFVSFYVEAETQIQETFSNDLGDSMLSSSVNQMSDMAKEIQFLMGYGAGVEIEAASASGFDGNMQMLDDIVGKYNNPSHLVERLKTGVSTVATGGKLIFPQIYKDSSYTKSYDITVKLQSPDGDKLSIFMNIFVPLYHLLAMVLPISHTTNGYSSPFLVRGFYKGFFNVDMGIITDMTITKGDEGEWNINGLPTEMEVRFTLKDLYNVMAMSSDMNATDFMKNTPYLDFMLNMVGVNINQPELFRTLRMFGQIYGNKIHDIPANMWMTIQEDLSNYMKNSWVGSILR